MTLTSSSTRGLVWAMLVAAVMVPAVQAAETPSEDPAAQAAAYTQKAAELRADAQKHEAIAKVHRAGAGSSKIPHEDIARHCEKLAQRLRAAADESESIATAYRSLAEKK